MHDGICPLCGAAEVYTKEGGIISETAGWLIVRPWKLFRPKVFLYALICGACGHVALQVPRRSLAELQTTFKEDLWKHVPPANQPPA